MAAPKPGGFKMSLGGLKTKPGLKASALQKDAKRPRLALGDDEEDNSNKQQEISGWDAAEGGALDASGRTERKGPLVIPALPNRNLRDEARRKQQEKAARQQAQNGNTVEHVEAKIQYGLTIVKKDELQEAEGAETSAPGEPMDVDEKDDLTPEQRLEKKALDALLNGKATDDDLVIPIPSEEEVFLNDLRDAPEAPTLEAYEAVPIEGFGAALLRGMGWKEGDAIGMHGAATKQKEVKRRPALLGIGAKEEAAVGVELGAWGSGNKGKGKGKKVQETYNPVSLRNKHTGEIITEEELKAKLESQDMVQEEKPEKGKKSSRYDDDGDEDRRRRDKRDDRRRDDDYDSERRRHRNDDRRRDKDRESSYYDSERRSSRREDRDPRERDRRRDRDRTCSPDERRDKKRDRYRSRSRDDEDRRGKRRERDHREWSRSRDDEERRKRRREKDDGYDGERGERRRR